jgi:hypothetical protein
MARAIGTLPRRQLARRLRELRDDAGLTLRVAARRMEISISSLSRVENGTQRVDVHWMRDVLDVYEVVDGRREELIELCRRSREPGWWRAYRPRDRTKAIQDRGYVPLEAGANRVHEFNMTIVPGLLQIPAYSHALFDAAAVPMDEADRVRQVEARMIRQRRLFTEQDPLELVAVLDESVLHRPVCGPTVLHDQLDHLVMVAELDTVTLQVLPTTTGAHPGLCGSFVLLSFADPDEPDLAYTEYVAGATHSEDPDAVRRCRITFDRVQAAALSPADTLALLERLTVAP